MTHQQAVQQQGTYYRFNGAVFSDVSFGFMPAFKNIKNQQTHISTDADGQLSVMHLLDGLPDSWIEEKDEKGKALTLKSEIIAGFMRNADFYTLNEIIQTVRDS